MTAAAPVRRVAVTGVGVVSSLGGDATSFWQACLAGRSRVEPVPAAWSRYADLRSRHWAPLGSAARPPSALLARIDPRRLDPSAQLALAAAEQAVRGAGLELLPVDAKRCTFRLPAWEPSRAGVFFGTGIGGYWSHTVAAAHNGIARPRSRLLAIAERLRAEHHDEAADELAAAVSELLAPEAFNPFTVPMTMPNAPGAQLAIKLGLHGPSRTFTGACASSTVAIGQAFRAVRDGECDAALTGGSEYLADPAGTCFRAFDALGALAHGELPAAAINRPFDARRSGFLFAEGGAAVLVLEEQAAARRRGAHPLAELIGYGETCDAHDIVAVAPAGEQLRRALRACLEEASLGPAEVGYVNAHGTGTAGNDPVECSAIAEVLGPDVAVSSTKSLLGHTLGASGALEAVATVLALRDGVVHPSRNLEQPIAPLRFVTRATPLPLRHALSQSFAFGGQNAVLAFRRA